ncbi:NBR1-Ig-like domain-containing protein [Actinocorallia sp. B10E7]|uniref:NBR1-Ig-like domain-containing protein n=1 Tax=Actinocorallia sp. B10E7 TaxID=3153558 RepID=UPI00325C6C05
MREPAQVDGRGQRGRKPNRPDPDEGPVAAFADRLWRLKIEAGDPSFAEMSSLLGAAASKSSLASAAQGRTLPSWGTTWEFVRVLAVERLGRDPEETEREWHEVWRRTKVLMELQDADLAGADVAVEKAETAVVPSDARPEVVTVPVVRPPSPPRRSRLRGGLAAVVVFAVLAVVAGGAAFFRSGSSKDPVEQRAQPPLQVDDSRFEKDVTYPDGTLVEKGETFEKVWRLRNTGTVEWKDRFLMRANDTICHAPERAEIPRTSPGQSVDIRVRVRAPEQSGTCRIYWKMVDAQGRTFFPGKRAIFLDVRVG